MKVKTNIKAGAPVLGEPSRRANRFVFFTVFVSLALVSASDSLAKSNSGKATKLAKIAGPVYAKLAADWWDYFINIPRDVHPALQPDGPVDCMINQRGNVWFIPSPGPDDIPRHFSCVIKRRTLFLPLLTQPVFDHPPFFGEIGTTLENKRNFLDGVDNAFCGRAWLDGEQTSRTTPTVIIQSVPFLYESGVDGAPDVFGLTPGDVFDPEALAGGYWVLLPPLSEGEHTLRITGGVGCDPDTGEPLFGLDNTYTLTVVDDDDDGDDDDDDDDED